MNEQIESSSILFADMMKNNKRRTVTYSCIFVRVLLQFCGFRSSKQKKLNQFNFLLQFCGFRSSKQKKLNQFNFLCTPSRTASKKSAYGCVVNTQVFATVRDLAEKSPKSEIAIFIND